MKRDKGEDEVMSYSKAGVDIVKEGEVINAIVQGIISARRQLHGAEVGISRGSTGGFTGLVALGDTYLSLCTDGVGTKILIARALGKYDTVGIDCIAMNVNDMICAGARPIAFVDYLAMERMDDDIAYQIGVGLGRGAEEAGISIIGGETATLGDIINGLDLAGTALGYVKKGEVIEGRGVMEGDALIGLESSGLHSNGYTLVRRVVEGAGLNYKDPLPQEYLEFASHIGVDKDYESIGDMLLEPTRIYVRTIMHLLEAHRDHIHGMAHITGGGLRNLSRINPGYDYIIEHIPYRNPVFPWLMDLGHIGAEEMYQTFNMGLGFVIVVDKAMVDDVIHTLKSHADYGVEVIGHVSRGNGRVEYQKDGVVFKGYM